MGRSLRCEGSILICLLNMGEAVICVYCKAGEAREGHPALPEGRERLAQFLNALCLFENI